MRTMDRCHFELGAFLFLEPFFGGSHRDFAEGLKAASCHRIDLMTMSARFWRWRMGGAALHFVRRLPDLSAYDGIIASSLMSLCDLKALAPGPCPPMLAYFHENQLTYPVSPGESRDVPSAWIHVTTALAAERVLFNSRYHQEAFFDALPGLVRRMPDYRPGWVSEAIRRKASVLYPGCRFPARREPLIPWSAEQPPLVVWNHRWEHDKDPEAFFQTLDVLVDRGIPFRLALLGQRFQRVPDAFPIARERYGSRMVQYGFVPSRKAYLNWLKRGTVVVSSAVQENFGIAVVEAVRCGCIPILPKRLSYPELIPPSFHRDCLYEDATDFVEKLSALVIEPSRFESMREPLSEAMERFSWERCISGYDRILDELRSGAED